MQALEHRTCTIQTPYIKETEINPAPPSVALGCFSQQAMQKDDNWNYYPMWDLAFFNPLIVNKPSSNVEEQVNLSPIEQNQLTPLDMALLTPLDLYGPSIGQYEKPVIKFSEDQKKNNEVLNRAFLHAVEKVYPPAPIFPIETSVDNKPVSINNGNNRDNGDSGDNGDNGDNGAQLKSKTPTVSGRTSLDNDENVNPLYRVSEQGHLQNHSKVEMPTTKVPLINTPSSNKNLRSRILGTITNLISPKK